MEGILYIGVCSLIGILLAKYAEEHGKKPMVGFFMGFVFNIIGAILYILYIRSGENNSHNLGR